MPDYRTFFYFLRSFEVDKSKAEFKDFLFWLTVTFFTGGILLWYPVKALEKSGIMSEVVEKKYEFEYSFFVVSAVLISPVIEELIFRFPLKYFLKESYFKHVIWFSIILFGLIHATNYELKNEHFFFLPVILASQFWGGLMLSFIRLRFGIWMAVLMHSSYNGLCLIWDKYIGF